MHGGENSEPGLVVRASDYHSEVFGLISAGYQNFPPINLFLTLLAKTSIQYNIQVKHIATASYWALQDMLSQKIDFTEER